MNTNSSNDDDPSLDITFTIQLCNYFNCEKTLEILLTKISQTIAQQGISKIERTLLQLILAVNPKTQSYNSGHNKDFIQIILKYLIEKKKNKLALNPVDVFNICANFFGGISLYRKLFEKDNNLINREELYLEMIIPFIPDKQINLTINVIKNKIKVEEVKFLEEVFKNINFKEESSFIFLKKIIIGIINSNGNLIQEIQNIRDNFLDNEKNEFLRCDKCSNFPILFLDSNKKINIGYSCGHFNEKDPLQQEKIINSRPKCFNCQKSLYTIHRNYLCSNCKNLLCNECLQIHFNVCLTLFYIPFLDVGTICSEHNLDYDTFCSICNKNLCIRCKQEHQHYSNYSKSSFSGEDRKKIEDIINSDNINSIHCKKLIKLIISDQKYLNNLQFHYFLENLIEKKNKFECGFFKEFGDTEFNEYYSTLINQYKKGNDFYRKIYREIKNSYNENNLKINSHEYDIDLLLTKVQKDSRAYSQNSFKISLIINYFATINELKDEIKAQENISKTDILRIKEEKSEIKANSFLQHSNEYKAQAIKLLDRSIANNILSYLIIRYPNYFQKINCGLNIYNDIKENFSNNKPLIEEFEKNNKITINELLENTKEKLNGISSNSRVDSSSTENITKADIKFVNPITIGNKTVSVEDLNIILEYLFYLRNGGNDVANPNSNDKTSISLKQNGLNKDNSKNDISKFINNFINIFQNYNFKENISNKCLLECLFQNKYENLLSKVETNEISEINQIIAQGKHSDFNKQIDEEFKKLDESLNSFKRLHISLLKYNKETKMNDSLNKFYDRLYISINNKESSLELLTNLMNFEYENSLFGDMTNFISSCFNFIINNLLEKNKSTLNQFEEEIKRMKIKRYNNRIILDTLKKLNEKTFELEEGEKEKKQISFFNGFVDYLNKEKNKEGDKIEYSQGNTILESIKNNLEILLT